MLPLQSNVSFHGGNSKYSADATAARAFLISFFNWTILDGGLSDSPTVTHPDDVIYVHRTTGNQISWVVTDPTTGTRSFTIYRNGSSVSSGSWTSGIAVVRNVDGLAVGSYSYRIIAYDGQSGSVSDTVLVTVLNAAPTVSTPSDITFTEGQTGNAISWIITDWSTGTKSYSIYRNDTSIVNGSWTSGISVTQSLNGLAIGSFNYSIIAWDGLGGVVVDEIIVSVVNGNPIITHPADVSYVVGQTSRAISWIITDASMGPLLYTVYQNGISTVNGSWVSGVAVVMNVDGLAIGSYNFTIIARDGYGASSADSVFVTVTSQPSLATPGYPIVGVLTCLVIGIAITGLTTRWQNAISHKKNQ